VPRWKQKAVNRVHIGPILDSFHCATLSIDESKSYLTPERVQIKKKQREAPAETFQNIITGIRDATAAVVAI
jgi:hypothetical protein